MTFCELAARAPGGGSQVCDDDVVDPLARERDRLLQRSARVVGISCSIVSLAGFLIPGVLSPELLIAIVPLFTVLIAIFIVLANSRSLLLVVSGILAGLATLFIVQLPGNSETSLPLLGAMTPLAAGGIGSFAMVLISSRLRFIIMLGSFAITIALMIRADPSSETLARGAAIVTFGWAILTVFAFWLTASVPRAAKRIYSIGRAHRAERRASETEAQRRQSARLLHDTVLATLTLLAHSGIGVSPEPMRQQAADDARLLRQLRLGVTTNPSSSGSYNLEPVAETPLGTTLESVKQRFGRIGLEVAWHGTGHVLLPSDTLDAFLLALSECLENVRRHAQVSDAHVTITEDDDHVRAMVTDAGVGFLMTDITEQNLGLKESVMGRLTEVGGSARFFSSPGAGTTVVLEVPRA